jgi:hypothetical protein
MLDVTLFDELGCICLYAFGSITVWDGCSHKESFNQYATWLAIDMWVCRWMALTDEVDWILQLQ